MRTLIKRTVASIMVILILLTSAPLSGFVGMDWNWLGFSTMAIGTAHDFEYLISSEDEIVLKRYIGDDSYVCIPKEIEGKTVTTILPETFQNCTNLLTVEIPKTINQTYQFNEDIGSGVRVARGIFDGCTNLYKVIFEYGTTKILDYICFESPSLKEVDIPETVLEIGERAFGSCYTLESIELHEGLKMLYSAAFSHCDSLKFVMIPSTCEYITTSRYGSAFLGCNDLVEIKVSDDNEAYCDINGVLFNKEKSRLIYYPEGRQETTYVVPDGVDSLAAYSFSWGKYLRKIYLPDSIDYIDKFAFEACYNLKELYYEGTEEKWNEIEIRSLGNDDLLKSIIHFENEYKSDTIVEKKDKDITYISDDEKDDNNTDESPEEKNQSIVICPKEKNLSAVDKFVDFVSHVYNKIPDVTITGATNQTFILNKFKIYRNEVTEDRISFNKNNYRTYVIPTQVLESWNTYNGTEYEFDMYMEKDKKDGKPYISSVFGRITNLDEYVDLKVSELEVNKGYLLNLFISVDGLSGGETVEKYYISQDDSHKVVLDNEAASINLHDNFIAGRTICVYAKTNSGRYTEPEKIKIKIIPEMDMATEKLLNLKEYNLFGNKNSNNVVIPKNKDNEKTNLLEGLELDISLLECPLGIDVTGNNVKVSIGVDLFGEKSEESGGEIEDNGVSKKEKWSGFKKSINLFGEEIFDENGNPKPMSQIDEGAFNKYKKIVNRYWDNDGSFSTKNNSMNCGIIGYLEGEIINGKLVIKDIYGMFTAEFKINFTHNTVVYCVPVYFYVEGGIQASNKIGAARVVADSEVPLDFGVTLSGEPYLRAGGGAGVKNVISGGIWGQCSLPYTFEIDEKHLLLNLKGQIGIEGEFFIFSGELAFWGNEEEDQLLILDHYFGHSNKLLKSFGTDYINRYAMKTKPTVSSRAYAEDTSEWLGGYPISIYSLADNGVTFNVLQTGIFNQSNPQLVSFGDNVMMTWVQDDASRDTYNRMRLVYSLYDAENDSWSEPKAVYDDGHNDAYPSLATDGENVYVTWQKIDKTVTSSDATSVDIFLKKSEIFVAKYDATNDCFVNVAKLTDNEVYDYMPSVVVNNGNAVAYYATNSDNNLMGTDNNTLHRHEIGETAEVLSNNQSYIISATSEIVNGTEKLSYSVDTDGDMSTSNDITVYTISNGETTSFGKDENEVAYTFADYSMLDGTETLFVSDMNNIYYEQDGETKTVFNGSRLIEGNISFVEQETGLSILWTENNEVGGDEFWTTSYEDGAWTEPVQISNIGGFKVSKADVAMLGDKLVGVCNMNEITLDEESGTYTEGEANLCSFTANDFTDISVDIYMVDESTIIPGETSSIDVFVNNVGTTDVTSIEFLLSDTLGTNTTVTKEVNIKSGATELVTLDYLVPENYAATTLTVSASIPSVEESDTEDNTESIEIGKGDLSIVESELVNFGDNYILKAVVENNSSVDAEGVVVSAIFNNSEEESFEQCEIGALAKEQYVDYELAFNKDLVEFDENGVGKLYLKVTSSSNESADGDNQICVAVTLPQETECAHPLTETVEAKAATCTEVGYNEHTICNACQEKITEYIEQPIIEHKDVDRDNLCDSCEKSINDISVGERKTIEISSNEITYLKFVAYETGKYIFESHSDEDTYGYLFDSEKNQLTYNDDGENGSNFSVLYTLTEGETYYWGARFFSRNKSGSFDVTLTTVEPCRHEDVEMDEGTSATCTSSGYTAGLYCYDCEEWVEGHEYIDSLGHSYSSSYTIDTDATCLVGGLKSKHCTRDGCSAKTSVTAIDKLAHAEVKVSAVPSTCTKTGLTEGKKCADCGKVTLAQKTVAKKVHTNKTTVAKATLSKNGKIETKCTACGYTSNTTVIYAPKTVKLSVTSYTYNGKAKTPSVTVKDSKGKKLKNGTDYTVKYSKGRKSIGKYTVTVTFKGNYNGTKKLTFEIIPAKVTLSKLTAGSKALTATWKAVSGVTGYEVQYSTSKKFTSKTTKTVKIKSSKTKKTTIKKLTKGKKYYVRIRAYKTVNKKPVYGAWSSVKSIKVK